MRYPCTCRTRATARDPYTKQTQTRTLQGYLAHKKPPPRRTLEHLPAAVGDLVHLRELHVDIHHERVLPNELFTLKNLRVRLSAEFFVGLGFGVRSLGFLEYGLE